MRNTLLSTTFNRYFLHRLTNFSTANGILSPIDSFWLSANIDLQLDYTSNKEINSSRALFGLVNPLLVTHRYLKSTTR